MLASREEGNKSLDWFKYGSSVQYALLPILAASGFFFIYSLTREKAKQEVKINRTFRIYRK
jgi:hypothetical protein